MLIFGGVVSGGGGGGVGFFVGLGVAWDGGFGVARPPFCVGSGVSSAVSVGSAVLGSLVGVGDGVGVGSGDGELFWTTVWDSSGAPAIIRAVIAPQSTTGRVDPSLIVMSGA